MNSGKGNFAAFANTMTTFRFYEMLKASSLAEQKLASPSALCSMDLMNAVGKLHALVSIVKQSDAPFIHFIKN
jgi:hypothetical protein